VTRAGEPWTFGLDPAETTVFLSQRGYRLTEDFTTAEAGARYFPARTRRERGSRLYHVVRATVTE